MRTANAAAVFAAAVALGGCVPVLAYDVPTIHVRVVDRQSGAPLAGAGVTVMTGGDRAPPHAMTAADGTATIDPVTHWTVIVANVDPLPIGRILEVYASGYIAKSADICFTPIKTTAVVTLTVALDAGTGPQSRVHQAAGPCF